MKDPRKFWDRIAEQYTTEDSSSQMGSDAVIEHSRKYLEQNHIILDFACGTGMYTKVFANDVQRVIAIDTSEKMIEQAMKSAAESGIENIEYLQTSLFDEQLGPSSFDILLAFNILHLLDAPEVFLQRMSTLLRPGGLLISVTPCLAEKLSAMNILMRMLSRLGVVPKIHAYKLAELEGLISGEGFHLVESEDLSTNYSESFVVARKH